MMPDQAQLMKRQQVLADFGEFAIRSDDLDEVLTEACRLVSEALGTERSKVLEIQEGQQELLVRAGVGWPPGVVGTVRLPMDERSSESYAIEAAEPVISQDISTETRFDIPEFMKKAGIVAFINVPIFVPGKRPYGILQVDATKPRDFGEDEVQFLRTYAMILGPVIDRVHLLEARTKDRERLEASEARHRLLIESWAQTVWEADADGVVVTDSPSWRAYTGQTLEEWLGYGWLDAVHPEDRSYAERHWREAIAAGRNVDAEFRLQYALGGWRWTNVRAAPVRNQEGKVQKWAGMNIDIHARKQAEEALRESEERFRMLFDTMDEGYVLGEDVLDEVGEAVDITFLEANPAAVRLAGRELTNRNVREIDSGYEEVWYEAYGRVALTGESLRAEYYAEPHGRWFDFQLSKVGPPESRRVASVFQDITDRKQSEGALRGSERWLQTLMKGVPQLVWRAVGDGRWTWASPQWTEFTGQGEAASHGWGWLDVVHPDDRAVVKERWAAAIESGQFQADYRICHAGEKRYRWFQTRAAPVRDDAGMIVEWLGTSTDVDDLRTLQDRQQVLLAELQHRVRNILAVIRSIISRSNDGERDTEDYVAHLQGRIAALARTQVLLTRAADADVDLELLIRDEIVAQAASEDQINLVGETVGLSPKSAEVLTLAIHELATNATKYGAFSRASGRLEVSWQIESREGQEWLLILWREGGVPIVDVAPRRQGFGMELIRRRIPYELKGYGSVELKPGGLECRIEFPLVDGDSILQTNAGGG